MSQDCGASSDRAGMTSPIQQIARLAYKTFLPRAGVFAPIQENFNQLVKLTNQITAEDVNFNTNLVKNASPYCPSYERAPVTYVGLWEDEVISMGIFVLRHGVALPLHDHPGMYGVCKVIHGTLGVTSYHYTDPRPVPSDLHSLRSHLQPTICAPRTEVTVNDHACVLSPRERNFHEMRAVHGPAAFLDILAPPYEGAAGRDCHYYREVATDDDQVTWLQRIPQPLEFWCDRDDYRGPRINPLVD